MSILCKSKAHPIITAIVPDPGHLKTCHSVITKKLKLPKVAEDFGLKTDFGLKPLFCHQGHKD